MQSAEICCADCTKRAVLPDCTKRAVLPDCTKVTPPSSCYSEFNSVVMEQWTVQHRAFVVETFFKCDSVVKTQRLFRRHFNVGRHGHIPCRNTILKWVENFRSTASASKRKPPGSVRTVRTPENIERVRDAMLRSPCR